MKSQGCSLFYSSAKAKNSDSLTELFEFCVPSERVRRENSAIRGEKRCVIWNSQAINIR